MCRVTEIIADPLAELADAEMRACRRAGLLASELITEEGEFEEEALRNAVLALKGHLHSLLPGHQSDGERNGHMLRMLGRLLEEPKLRARLVGIQEPTDNLVAVELVRETIGAQKVDRAATHRAVLAALLTPLRQIVGSCFATAPAILIQREQPEQFLEDMGDLIATGKLHRVVEGVEHTVPLCQSGQEGVDNPLLRAWEYTLASLVETKGAFSRWNLFVSLGLEPKEVGGLGEVIAREVEGRLASSNRAMEAAQSKYEVVYRAVKFAEARLRRASEDEGRWMQAEYRRKLAEMDGYLEERDAAHGRAQKLAGMLRYLVEAYSERFPEYFQEVYDPEMHGLRANPFDDSPAGFRLLYKHGRANPSMWTLIHTPDEFVNFLVEFFIVTETALVQDFQGVERELSEVVGAVVRHVRSDEFLETAFARMARRYGKKPIVKPLDNLEKIEAKPWSYLSGGTMAELVATYFRRAELPTLRKRKVKNPFDLFVFVLEAMKEHPGATGETMLMESPTHAFLFCPGMMPFKEGWLDSGHTPTWVRDVAVKPMNEALASIRLEAGEMEELVERIAALLPVELRYPFVQGVGPIPHSRHRVKAFCRLVMRAFEGHQELGRYAQATFFEEALDGLLYEILPLFPGHQLAARASKVLGRPVALPAERRWMGARELYEACLGAMREEGRSSSAEAQAGELRAALEREGFALPRPILFANTNWVREYFGFMVSPTTGKLMLWRSDPIGLEAAPMSRWQIQIHSKQTWAIYSRPFEYRSPLANKGSAGV